MKFKLKLIFYNIKLTYIYNLKYVNIINNRNSFCFCIVMVGEWPYVNCLDSSNRIDAKEYDNL